MDILELFAIALAPGVAIMLFIYLKDKHEREPITLLFISFLYGVTSTFLTLVFSEPLKYLVSIKQDSVVDQFIEAFFKVALVEESCKFLFVRGILYYNKNFNEPFDGIVYAVMVGMGFATLENVLYAFNFGMETALLRMFTAVPAHATFAVMMGYYLGKAKFTHRRGLSFAALALVAPVIFHGAYDYFLMIAEVQGIWTGIWVLAFFSLAIGILLSRNAIRLHQQASPFITQKAVDSDPSLPV